MPRPSKNDVRVRVHSRIRQRVRGTEERPRLAVFRSLNHIYAQVIDDRRGHTLAAASSGEKSGDKKSAEKKTTEKPATETPSTEKTAARNRVKRHPAKKPKQPVAETWPEPSRWAN